MLMIFTNSRSGAHAAIREPELNKNIDKTVKHMSTCRVGNI